jgi:hypothetical protein
MRTLGTGPMVPSTVRTPFSEWNRLNSRACAGPSAAPAASDAESDAAGLRRFRVDFGFSLGVEDRLEERKR